MMTDADDDDIEAELPDISNNPLHAIEVAIEKNNIIKRKIVWVTDDLLADAPALERYLALIKQRLSDEN